MAAACVIRVALFAWRFVVPLIFFVYCYWRIIAALRRSAKVGSVSHSINVRQREQHAAGPSTSAASAAAAAAPGTSSHSKPLSSSRKNVIKTMIVVTACFIVCWLPVQFMLVAEKCGLPAFSPLTYYALVVIAFVNHCANPFIYATGLYQSLRVKCTALLYRVTCRNQVTSAS